MGAKHGAGKGDRYRKVDLEKWNKGWENIFENKNQKESKNVKKRNKNSKTNNG